MPIMPRNFFRARAQEEAQRVYHNVLFDHLWRGTYAVGISVHAAMKAFAFA